MGFSERVASEKLKFGRWTVLRDVGRTSDRCRVFECICDCGTVRNVRWRSLTSGRSRSCGCFLPEAARLTHTKHGQSRSVLYKIWRGMRNRCDPRWGSRYPRHGGRGIRVCDRWWNSFETFLADMGPRPEGSTLERIDNDGHYEPGNCRWASWKEQGKNRHNTAFLTFGGVTKPIVDWARSCGIDRKVLAMRIKLGWDPERAMSVPVRRGSYVEWDRLNGNRTSRRKRGR